MKGNMNFTYQIMVPRVIRFGVGSIGILPMKPGLLTEPILAMAKEKGYEDGPIQR